MSYIRGARVMSVRDAMATLEQEPLLGDAFDRVYSMTRSGHETANDSRFCSPGFVGPSIDSIASIFVAKIDFDLTC